MGLGAHETLNELRRGTGRTRNLWESRPGGDLDRYRRELAPGWVPSGIASNACYNRNTGHTK